MKRLVIAVCLALVLPSCTDKSKPADSAAKKPQAQNTSAARPGPDLPGTFALERSVRNQLNVQRQKARDRAKQFEQAIGH